MMASRGGELVTCTIDRGKEEGEEEEEGERGLLISILEEEEEEEEEEVRVEGREKEM